MLGIKSGHLSVRPHRRARAIRPPNPPETRFVLAGGQRCLDRVPLRRESRTRLHEASEGSLLGWAPACVKRVKGRCLDGGLVHVMLRRFGCKARARATSRRTALGTEACQCGAYRGHPSTIPSFRSRMGRPCGIRMACGSQRRHEKEDHITLRIRKKNSPSKVLS